MNIWNRYAHWLHLRWPAGTVENLPEVGEGGRTNLPGVFVTGDLTGIPLLKFSLDSGARVIKQIVEELGSAERDPAVRDVAIIGGGVSGMAAAVEAAHLGLDYELLEAAEPFFTIANFPKGKPIYTYPKAMRPEGGLQISAHVKEDLLDELRNQVAAAGVDVRKVRVESVSGKDGAFVVALSDGGAIRARKVVVAIGRSGNFRRLGVPGEDLPKVYNRLYDPKDFCGQEVLVVGGGDSAMETAIALARCGGRVTVSYRGEAFSRAKPDNIEMLYKLVEDPGRTDVRVSHPTSERVTTAVDDFVGTPPSRGKVTVMLGSTVTKIEDHSVSLRAAAGGEATIPNQVVFPMIGREPPLDFFRRSGIRLLGDFPLRSWIALSAFLVFCAWLYNWKSGGFFGKLWADLGWFPTNLPTEFATMAADPTSLLGTIVLSASGPSFWYTLAYSALVVVFGFRRIRRRRTPYVTAQTSTLMAIQVVPLFLLPEIILPQLSYLGWLPAWLADPLFPEVTYGHGREFWRAYGLILAWPLNVYNVFTEHPLPAWLWIAGAQTVVLIPLGIYFFGKGVYCGWICSCGALAETLGDTLRHKMPHGPKWNRLNFIGQGVLSVAVILLVFRIVGWLSPDVEWVRRLNDVALSGGGTSGVFRALNYKWTVDVFLAGILGYGLYFWFSGRVWCRFACPLAAYMHVVARFSRFRILSDKKKCISCNVCTSVCHQGIDIMNFANKGVPMSDPECVRCSACVQSCPTGVLTFGRVDASGEPVAEDRLAASPVQMREGASGTR